MRIVLVRHEKVDMKWNKRYTSEEFDAACLEYDKSHIVDRKEDGSQIDCDNMEDDRLHVSGKGDDSDKVNCKEIIYISELLRTYETACRLFGMEREKNYCRTFLLNEVPLRSFKDTEKKYPLWMWNFVGRLQWLFGNKRQAECRRETVQRADEMIDLAERSGKDCYMITHGFYLRTFLHVLKKRGYCIKRNYRLGIENLDEITAIST